MGLLRIVLSKTLKRSQPAAGMCMGNSRLHWEDTLGNVKSFLKVISSVSVLVTT